uniref:Protein anti-silencing 1-like isoform X1 n=1 Tax=Tanacetum cinerariifolium TaxID=118510 RepID=A0A6L2NLE2_TANCI|nr:protein anti-silencing 1-like isoform X1 [Tanacetum cinerariifolium]
MAPLKKSNPAVSDMAPLKKSNPAVSGDIKFKWGQKGRRGGKDPRMHYYGSFTYDDVEYSLYDSVYMWSEGQPSPNIGKIVKIYETPLQKKMVKVVWYFRPAEVKMWLNGTHLLQNELFLASGEGQGLSNVNVLESISGKCNVVCTSKDKRNPQATEEELKMSDYVFYRTFDVKECKLSEIFPDKIAGVEVGNYFNPQPLGSTKVTAVIDEDSVCGELTNKTYWRFPAEDAGRRPGSSSSASDSYPLKKSVVYPIKKRKLRDIMADERKHTEAQSRVEEHRKRPKVDSREWFKKLPWEERMQKAKEIGSVVLLENLYPLFASSEVEDIVLDAFNIKVSAKMVQQTADTRSNNGQALVIFNSKQEADFALSELRTKCLMIGGKRPVVGSRPSFKEPGNNEPKYFGHFAVGRRQWKNAGSTSHYAQPNTITFDMAMEWQALQKKSELCWDALFEQHSKEQADLKALLKDPPVVLFHCVPSIFIQGGRGRCEKATEHGTIDANGLNSSQQFTYAKVATPDRVKNKVRILQKSKEISQKPDKNGHENGKSTQEPEIIKL